LSCTLRKLFISFYLIYLPCWSSILLLNPVPSGTVLSFTHNPESLLNSSFVYFFVLLPTIYDIYWFVLKSYVFYIHKVHLIPFFIRVWISIKKTCITYVVFLSKTKVYNCIILIDEWDNNAVQIIESKKIDFNNNSNILLFQLYNQCAKIISIHCL